MSIEYTPTANTQGLYRLEDLNDTSGNSRTLTNTGVVTFTEAKFTNGANFGSANTTKYLSVANAMGINGNAVTISGWVKILAAPASTVLYTLLSQGASSSKIQNLIQYYNNSGTLQVLFSRTCTGGGGTTGEIIYSTTLTVNAWYHLLVTYDNTNVVGYINGASRERCWKRQWDWRNLRLFLYWSKRTGAYPICERYY